MNRQSLLSTMPADSVRSAMEAWQAERPSWCVDMGPELRALSTAELWVALAKGQVTPAIKVWREGMPHWEAVGQVPEFALALPDAPVWEQQPALPDASIWGPPEEEAPASAVVAVKGAAPLAAAAAAIAARSSRETLPGGLAASAEEEQVMELARTGGRHAIEMPAYVETLPPPSDGTTPAPMVVDHEVPAPPQSQARPRPWWRLERRGAVSVVLGAAVAVLALAAATTGVGRRGEDAGSAGARPVAAAAAERGTEIGGVVEAAPQVPAQAAPAMTAEPTANAAVSQPGAVSAEVKGTSARRAPGASLQKPRAPRGPRFSDRGQRRAR